MEGLTRTVAVFITDGDWLIWHNMDH